MRCAVWNGCRPRSLGADTTEPAQGFAPAPALWCCVGRRLTLQADAHRRAGAELAVTDGVAELVSAFQRLGRAVFEGAIAVQRDLALGPLGEGDDAQGAAFRVAVVGQYGDVYWGCAAEDHAVGQCLGRLVAGDRIVHHEAGTAGAAKGVGAGAGANIVETVAGSARRADTEAETAAGTGRQAQAAAAQAGAPAAGFY